MSAQPSLLNLHNLSCAVMGEYFGTPLPAHFGDFAAEYRAARDAVVLADTSYHALFSFTGPDCQRYLNAVLSSNVRDLQPGQGAVGLLLTPQGHIVAEVETYALADRVLAISHAMVRERAYTTLDKFIIMDDVAIEDQTGATARLSLAGPHTAEAISAAFGIDILPMPEFAHADAQCASIPCRVIRRARYGVPGADMLVKREQAAALWQRLDRAIRPHGGVPAGLEALNTIRLEHRVPWFGTDYDEKQIPHEAAVEQSHINYEKGCYTGQEIVERVRSRGHVNRRLALLQFFTDAPPPPETKLFVAADACGAPESEAGYVTSAAISPLLGRAIGFAYLRRDHSAIGTRLDASGAAAEVITAPASV